ncbi:phenylacetate--CoA ligase family protein [Caulobacter sp. 17J65-9]|uniref:phenylacetate--CoA ligase family protein n=1 Tax=Caulobacter sp. 17J65-9 TaxID=2709382 RepID=UPI0013C99D8F|nr:phenylacetate--CoA ligase family protein [Caulobacter sp. 17J65-9]NEX91919.1 phenylacetate--CoA ligase family protein [Caulobacter sp. 17J65-9]
MHSAQPSVAEARRLHGQLYDMLTQSQYWSADRMAAHQRGQLAHLLRHARATVPFYETRLDAVLGADGEIDWDRWHEIPVLTRADLQTRYDAMQSGASPPGHGEIMQSRSSGSTGQPIVTSQNALAALAASSATARAYDWHGIDVARTHVCVFGDDPQVGAYPDGLLHEPWGPPALRTGAPGRQYDLNLAASPDQALEFIQRRRPSYLSGLVTRLSVLAHEVLRRGLDIRVEAILPFGEAVSPARRKLFDDAFGARTIPFYASQETYRIAHACPMADHYHVNAELMLVEVVGDDGRPAAAGQPGRVVITPFYNTAQPLIRYQIGDIATASGNDCRCGRTLPVLGDILGRIAHMFRLPDGRPILPNISDDDVLELGAEIWQLAQVAPDRLEFRYVPGERAGDEDRFAQRLKAQLHPDFEIAFRRLASSDFQERRKFIPYLCELA